ncbi:MAG: cytochrome b/b6 domain-containing protein [Burkholderiales bacterium]|jgi:cytochrome b561
MKNSATRYGPVTKILHWTVFVLILNQFVVAAMMLNTPQGATTAGFTQGQLYNWHKSIGLIVLAVALARYIWRKTTPLPDFAPNLSDGEKRALGWIEPTLYLCMFLMPISGFVFVMTGGYGVNFFGVWHLPNFLGKHAAISKIAEWTHIVTAVVLFVTLLAHWTLGIRHQSRHRDRYFHRMLPFTHQK